MRCRSVESVTQGTFITTQQTKHCMRKICENTGEIWESMGEIATIQGFFSHISRSVC